jgi:hypothetical protein
VTYRFCHRCQSELPPHDDGTLIFCTHCGAPQVLLSEDLQTQVETLAKAAEDGAAAGPVMQSPRTLMWAGAFRCVGLAGIVAAALMLISLLVPPIVVLTLLWAIISPVVVIGLFQSRFPLTPISTGFGARLGLLTGLSVGVVLSIGQTAELLVRRFATHGRGMNEFDTMWNGLFTQLQANWTAQLGAAATPYIHMLEVPEFRAGLILASMGFSIVMLLAITTAGGAFAGFVRSRSRA